MKILFIALWLVHTLAWLPLCVLGWLLVPIAVALKAYKPTISIVNGREILNFTWPFMKPWNNFEDGIVAGEELIGKPEQLRILYWTLVRNPVNNLRFMPPFGIKHDASKVKFKLCLNNQFKTCITEKSGQNSDFLKDAEEGRIEHEFSYWAWQGLYANYRKEFVFRGTRYRFWIGWKIYCSDMHGISVHDYRYNGIGFAYQFKRVKS